MSSETNEVNNVIHGIHCTNMHIHTCPHKQLRYRLVHSIHSFTHSGSCMPRPWNRSLAFTGIAIDFNFWISRFRSNLSSNSIFLPPINKSSSARCGTNSRLRLMPRKYSMYSISASRRSLWFKLILNEKHYYLWTLNLGISSSF